MNWGKPWRGSRIKGRGKEVPARPIPWLQLSSREATTRGAAARPDGLVKAVVVMAAASAGAEAIIIDSSSELKAVVKHVRSLLASRRGFFWLPFAFLCSSSTNSDESTPLNT